MGVPASSSHVVSAAPSSSCSSPALAWGPSHGTQCSTNCSSTGPFHGVQSFRNRLLQYGSLMGSQVLPVNLLQCGLPKGSQPPSGIPLLWCGVLPGLQVEICSTVDLRGLQGHSVPHHGLLHRLQGNLCSGAWSTSSPSFFTGLGVCKVFSLTSSHSSLWLQLLLRSSLFPLLNYVIPEALPPLLMGSALVGSGSIL